MGWVKRGVPALALLAMLVFAAPASAVEYLQSNGFEGGRVLIREEAGAETSEGIVDVPGWEESDTVYASPICSKSTCGAEVGQGPRGGENWVLFGAYEG